MSQMFLNVVSTFKGEGITQATRQLGAFGKQTSSFGSILGKVGGALASFGVATKAIQFGRESITSARDLERNLYALNTVFDDLAPGMNQFAKDAENLGLSQSKAAKASVFIGSVLKQSGFAMSDVAKETKNLVTLGTDLAALYGYDVQEALLGMTALFRGEYDPIEKFGVAMKQSEINSELAARGQNNLEGAARRNAEQIIRLELLYERAADAMGAFTGQSGSLYTEQKKLGATFENMQAQVGTALLPEIVDLNEALRTMLVEITPYLIQSFERLAEVLEGIIGVFNDAMDPTTELGESFAALNIQAEYLGKAFGAENFKFDVFELGALIIRSVVDFVHDLMRSLEDVVIHLRVAGQAIHDFFFDREKFDNTDYLALRNELMILSDRAKDLRLDAEITTEEIKKIGGAIASADKATLDNLRNTIYKTGVSAKEAAIQMGVLNRAAGIKPGDEGGTEPEPDPDPTPSATAKKEPSIMQTLKQEATKSRLAGKLMGKNLSEGLAEQISDKGPAAARKQLAKIEKTAGKHATKLQKIYNRTAAGKAELQRIQDAIDAKDDEQKRKDDALAQELLEKDIARKEQQKRVYQSFLDSVKSIFSGIRDAITGAFDIKNLGGSTNSIIRNMNKLLSKVRDFSRNISQLATMGLDPALLQQVIQAGPVAGARLASALVAGGAGALGEINAGFSQIGSLASEIATTGTQSLFGQGKQETVYNINVSGGVGSGATIGKAIVDAIKDYERTSGAVWQGA
jgi:Skp family chaperone for outer membrane proteins